MAVVTRQAAPEKKMSDSHRAVSRGFERHAPATDRRNASGHRRWHNSPPPESLTESTFVGNTSVESTFDIAQADREWRELFEDFDREQMAALSYRRPKTKSEMIPSSPRRQTRRRRARAKHRPFHLSLPAVVMTAVPALLLVYLLSVNSKALTLSHQNVRMQNQMEETRYELQRIRKEIAAVNASAQVEEWARERGWRQATQQDFDDVSSVVGEAGRSRTPREQDAL